MIAKTISRTLKSEGHIRQVEICLHANRAANRTDRLVQKAWRKILALISRGDTSGVYERVHAIMGGLKGDLVGRISTDLDELANWTHRSTASHLLDTLPLPYLLHAARKSKNRPLREAEGDVDFVGNIGPQIIDWLAPLRTPPAGGRMPVLTAGQQKEMFRDMLFPNLTRSQVRWLIFGRQPNWEERIRSGTRLGDPREIGLSLVNGITRGKTPAEIARDIRPLVQGVSSTAKRIARTECMRVAGIVQDRCHNALGDLVIGWQVHATLDANTRPEHAARNGRIYYKKPKPGDHGLAEKPSPPLEADGTMAWNCRCYMTPVLSDPGNVPPDAAEPGGPLYVDADQRVVSNPTNYEKWFDNADERRKKLAVGAGAYREMKKLNGGKEPSWPTFINPDTGSLLTLRQLRSEDPEERAARMLRVRLQLQQQEQQKQAIRTFGFIHGRS
jgi:SPP1 gp7 family putative phage head morphogenesis protein